MATNNLKSRTLSLSFSLSPFSCEYWHRNTILDLCLALQCTNISEYHRESVAEVCVCVRACLTRYLWLFLLTSCDSGRILSTYPWCPGLRGCRIEVRRDGCCKRPSIKLELDSNPFRSSCHFAHREVKSILPTPYQHAESERRGERKLRWPSDRSATSYCNDWTISFPTVEAEM
jgi:hypothetical protein